MASVGKFDERQLRAGLGRGKLRPPPGGRKGA